MLTLRRKSSILEAQCSTRGRCAMTGGDDQNLPTLDAAELDPGARTAVLRGSLPFEEGDSLPLRGRDVQHLYTLIASRTFRFGILWGESGCGKTSLLRAGLVPTLRKNGFLPVYVPTPTKEPRRAIEVTLAAGSGAPNILDPKALLQLLTTKFDIEELRALSFDLGINYDDLRGDTKTAKALALVLHCERRDRIADLGQALYQERPQAFTQDVSPGASPAPLLPGDGSTGPTGQDVLGRLRAAAPAAKKVVVMLDQFEEFFLHHPTVSAHEGFLKWLWDAVADPDLPVVFLVSVRGSFLARLRQLMPHIPEATSPDTAYQLQNFDARQATQILAQATETDAIAFEPGLISAVVRDLERRGSIRPAELQLVATRLKLKNICSLDKYVSPLLPRVFVIVYNPIIEEKTGTTLIETFGWNDPDLLAAEYMRDIQECSDGLVIYQIVERNQFVGRVELDGFPVKADGSQYKPQEYVNALHGQGTLHDETLDYGKLLEEFNLLQRVANREFDEVWLFGFPYAGFWESTMAGKGAFFCNSPPVPHTGKCARRFMILGFSYERGIGEMLETLGHRAEAIMQRVYRRKKGKANLFEQFTRYDAIAEGQANVGTIHFAPNSQHDYDWGNMTSVRSFCDDWYQFPNMTGVVRTVDATEWGGGDIRAHHKWWLKHLPKATGTTDGVANNWWKYIIDPNNVV
jgi:hypothetical protein